MNELTITASAHNIFEAKMIVEKRCQLYIPGSSNTAESSLDSTMK